MSNFSETFDSSKNYRGLGYEPGQFVVAEQFNRVQDMQLWDSENQSIYSLGYQLKIDHNTNAPVLKVKANNDLGDGQVITVQAVDATHVKWRTNSGSWSGSIAVTADGVTWNTVGSSGLDIIFADTMAASDESEVWVAQAMRLLGAELTHTGGTTYELAEGKWAILGKYVELSSDSTVCNDGDYVYIKVTESEVDKSTDSTLGIFLGDGNYADKSPTALQREYDLMSSASFPNATSDPWVQYVLVGKVSSASGGVFTQMWAGAVDLQQLLRLYGDTEAPSTPTGLSLSSGSEGDLATIATGKAISVPVAQGYLTMSCDAGTEPDLAYWEFKVVRLDSGSNPTSDAQSYIINNNTAAGGMSVPTGISHTVHNLTLGVEYRVWVRAVDKAGNVSDWSSSVDETIGGDCQIPVGDSGPSFTLTDTPGYVGFTVDVTGLPTNAAGYSIWVGESSYPTPANNEGLIGHYPDNQASVKIPWPEGSRPYVVLEAFDAAGLYHVDAGGSVVSTSDNTELAESAQLSTESHNSDPSSHSGLIGDYATVASRWGSLDSAFARISAQAMDIGHLYIVADSGTPYSTVQGALSAIDTDSPARATILVAPGSYGGGSTLTFPDIGTGRINIFGLGSNACEIGDEVDLSNMATGNAHYRPKVHFHNMRFFLDVIGTNSETGDKLVAFTDCEFSLYGGTRWLDFDTTSTGAWNMRFESCHFYGDGSPMIDLENNIDCIFDNCRFSSGAMTTIVYFTTPSGSVRLFKNCAFELRGAATGEVMDADGGGPYDVWVYGNAWVKTPSARITVQDGSVSTNTVIASAFLTG